MDKKTIFWLVGGLGGIILLIVFLNFLNKVTVKTYDSYEKVESRLVSAAKDYYKDNESLLPTFQNTTSIVTLNTLVVGEYIKTLDKYLKDGDACDARVVVTKTLTDYDYVPYLECEDYVSMELYKKVLEDNVTILSNGVGLYSVGSEKIFKGEVKNNFIKLNDKYFRIIRIDEDNNLVLISHFRTDTYVWDDRYNTEISSNDGINEYEISRIKDAIEEEFYNGNLLKSSEKSKIVYSKSCVKYDFTTTPYQCLEYTSQELPVRLLELNEYLLASLDPNCKTIDDVSCINYNYMHDLQSSFWTMIKGQKNSSYVYSISTGGVTESRATMSKQIRYVIKLSSKAMYLKGNGTYDDPYEIR